MKHTLLSCLLVWLVVPLRADAQSEEIAKLRAENEKLRTEVKQLGEKLAKARAGAETQPGELLIPKDRWDFSTVVPKASLVVKSLTDDGKETVRITLEFAQTKDAETTGVIERMFRRAQSPAITFWFIDKERVAIYKAVDFEIEGEITGKKGEAFRIILKLPKKEILELVDRVEMRQ